MQHESSGDGPFNSSDRPGGDIFELTEDEQLEIISVWLGPVLYEMWIYASELLGRSPTPKEWDEWKRVTGRTLLKFHLMVKESKRGDIEGMKNGA